MENLRPEKQALWEQKRHEIDSITDACKKAVDEGIRETVIALQLLGIHTTQSCEGHLNWGVGAPWIEIAAPASLELQRLEEQRLHAFQKAEASPKQKTSEEEQDLLWTKAHELRCAVTQFHLAEAAKTLHLLEAFYLTRQVSADIRLILTFLAHGRCRLQSQGAAFQETAPPETKQPKLATYQAEMNTFTVFLKERFFSNERG